MIRRTKIRTDPYGSTMGGQGQTGGWTVPPIGPILGAIASGVTISRALKPVGNLNKLRKSKKVKLPKFLGDALDLVQKAGFGQTGGKSISMPGTGKRRKTATRKKPVGRPRKVGRPKKK